MMIEFNGYLTGTSQKFFCKQIVKLQQKFILFTCIPALAIMFLLANLCWDIIIEPKLIMITIILFIPLYLLPNIQTKKEKEKITPQRVYIDGDMIVSKSNAAADTRFMKDVKEVRDYGEFYYFVFKAYSYRFVCQKDLLTQGTIEEFETLFTGKIKKM